jgi:acetyl esterase/lipase
MTQEHVFAKRVGDAALPQDHITRKPVVYQIAGMEAATIRPDVEYRTAEDPVAGSLTMDLYYPPDAKSGARLPAVVFVHGYSDAGIGMPQVLGWPRFKEMAMSISWGQLAAASGVVGITYTNSEPTADLQALLQYVRQNAAALGVDENRIGLYASSGHVPLALSVLMQEDRDYLKCAILSCGYMLDLDGSSGVAEMAKQFGFVNPGAGKSVDDLRQDLPLFIVRAAQEQFPHLNEMIDRFAAKALSRNLPVTLVNHPGPHAFELMQDSETSRETIRQMLAFMRFHLRA